jgi:hypothetical protein
MPRFACDDRVRTVLCKHAHFAAKFVPVLLMLSVFIPRQLWRFARCHKRLPCPRTLVHCLDRQARTERPCMML